MSKHTVVVRAAEKLKKEEGISIKKRVDVIVTFKSTSKVKKWHEQWIVLFFSATKSEKKKKFCHKSRFSIVVHSADLSTTALHRRNFK